MKTLSLTQPYASLVAVGVKKLETRSWPTRYRGPLLIHAASGFPGWAREFAAAPSVKARLHDVPPQNLPRGVLLAVVHLVDCRPTTERPPAPGTDEAEMGDYGPKRFIWEMRLVYRLEFPYRVAGRLGLWEFNHLMLPERMRIEQRLQAS